MLPPGTNSKTPSSTEKMCNQSVVVLWHYTTIAVALELKTYFS